MHNIHGIRIAMLAAVLGLGAAALAASAAPARAGGAAKRPTRTATSACVSASIPTRRDSDDLRVYR
jgi:hypothetical protein